MHLQTSNLSQFFFSDCNQNIGHIPWQHVSQSALLRHYRYVFWNCAFSHNTPFYPRVWLATTEPADLNCWPIFFSSWSNQLLSMPSQKVVVLKLATTTTDFPKQIDSTSTSWTWNTSQLPQPNLCLTKQQQLHARRKRHSRWDLDELDLFLADFWSWPWFHVVPPWCLFWLGSKKGWFGGIFSRKKTASENQPLIFAILRIWNWM